MSHNFVTQKHIQKSGRFFKEKKISCYSTSNYTFQKLSISKKDNWAINMDEFQKLCSLTLIQINSHVLINSHLYPLPISLLHSSWIIWANGYNFVQSVLAVNLLFRLRSNNIYSPTSSSENYLLNFLFSSAWNIFKRDGSTVGSRWIYNPISNHIAESEIVQSTWVTITLQKYYSIPYFPCCKNWFLSFHSIWTYFDSCWNRSKPKNSSDHCGEWYFNCKSRSNSISRWAKNMGFLLRSFFWISGN